MTDPLRADERPSLGLATTLELLTEIAARMRTAAAIAHVDETYRLEMNAELADNIARNSTEAELAYRTVDS